MTVDDDDDMFNPKPAPVAVPATPVATEPVGPSPVKSSDPFAAPSSDPFAAPTGSTDPFVSSPSSDPFASRSAQRAAERASTSSPFSVPVGVGTNPFTVGGGGGGNSNIPTGAKSTPNPFASHRDEEEEGNTYITYRINAVRLRTMLPPLYYTVEYDEVQYVGKAPNDNSPNKREKAVQQLRQTYDLNTPDDEDDDEFRYRGRDTRPAAKGAFPKPDMESSGNPEDFPTEGEILGRVSTRSMFSKDWGQLYWVMDEHDLYLYRLPSESCYY